MTEPVLYGGKRSPFVRRVELWMTLQDRPYRRENAEIFGAEFEAFRALNPLSRVPVLHVPGIGPLIETAAIIDYLETTADGAKRLIPEPGHQRIVCQQRIGLANGIAEKCVAYVYETERRPQQFQWPDWEKRLKNQIAAGLVALNGDIPPEGWCGGEHIRGADIAAICAYDFALSLGDAFCALGLPRLARLSETSSNIAIFLETRPKPAR